MVYEKRKLKGLMLACTYVCVYACMWAFKCMPTYANTKSPAPAMKKINWICVAFNSKVSKVGFTTSTDDIGGVVRLRNFMLQSEEI